MDGNPKQQRKTLKKLASDHGTDYSLEKIRCIEVAVNMFDKI